MANERTETEPPVPEVVYVRLSEEDKERLEELNLYRQKSLHMTVVTQERLIGNLISGELSDPKGDQISLYDGVSRGVLDILPDGQIVDSGKKPNEARPRAMPERLPLSCGNGCQVDATPVRVSDHFQIRLQKGARLMRLIETVQHNPRPTCCLSSFATLKAWRAIDHAMKEMDSAIQVEEEKGLYAEAKDRK